MIVRLTQRRVTGFKDMNKQTAQCPSCIRSDRGRKRIVINSHGSNRRVLVRTFQGEVLVKSSYTRHAFGRRGVLEFNTRVQENTRPHKLATTTDEHFGPTTHQQGWRFDLVSSWRRGHTRGSRQDIICMDHCGESFSDNWPKPVFTGDTGLLNGRTLLGFRFC